MKKILVCMSLVSACSIVFAVNLSNTELSADLRKELNQAKISQEKDAASLQAMRTLVEKYYPAFVRTGAVEVYIGKHLSENPSWKIKKFAINKSNPFNWIVLINDDKIPLSSPTSSQTSIVQLKLDDAMAVWNNPALEADRKKIVKLSKVVWNYMSGFTGYPINKFLDNYMEEPGVYLGLGSIDSDRKVYLYIYNLDKVKQYSAVEITSDLYFLSDFNKKVLALYNKNPKDFYYTLPPQNGSYRDRNVYPEPDLEEYAIPEKFIFMTKGTHNPTWWKTVVYDSFREYIDPDSNYSVCYNYKPAIKEKIVNVDPKEKNKLYIKCLIMPSRQGEFIKSADEKWVIKPTSKVWNLDDF